jgi:hypothetical protein
MKEKYIESRTRLAGCEADNSNLKAMVTQLELQLSHSTKVGTNMQSNFFVQFQSLFCFFEKI